MDTKRIVVPAAEEIINRYFPVLDHGFVALVDYMGGDLSIERFARTSYTIGPEVREIKKTIDLIRYLYRMYHTSPFESVEVTLHLGLPIVVMRQWVRHRTACLAGDVNLHFDLPGGIERRGNQLYKMTVREAYEKFNKNPYLSSRIQGMNLRSLNEITLEVYHTHITDIWSTGFKHTYRVVLEDGSEATMSADHLCFTEEGWRKLGEAVVKLPTASDPIWQASLRFSSVGPGRDTAVAPLFNLIDPKTEEWLPVCGWEDWYEVSDQGRVRRLVGGQGVRTLGRCKKLTITNGHAVVSLNRPGYQATLQVHDLVLSAFVGPRPASYLVARHKDGNGLNNLLSNLERSTQQDNADDRVRDGATTRLKTNFSRVTNVEYVGFQETYDIEVEGPYHNFCAGGMIVHNSLNEFSQRYSPAPLLFYTPSPEEVCHQSGTNKQGSGQQVSEEVYNRFINNLTDHRVHAANAYQIALSDDIAREMARIDLPLSTYTYCYWKMDLKNFLHLIGLRSHPHAQKQTQAYSDVCAGIAKRLVPIAFRAFQDYQQTAVKFSQVEMAGIRLLASTHSSPIAWEYPPDAVKWDVDGFLKDEGLTKREISEFWGKLRIIVPKDYSLRVEDSRDPDHYVNLINEHQAEAATES